MSKMSSHEPFGHLKHELWPKEGPKVKSTIWLLITKSRESTWFLCVQVVCNIPLKSSQRGLWLCFKPHLNQRFAHKVMGPQNHGSPNFGNFGTSIWESRDKNVIWMWALWRGTKYTIRGKVVASPQVQAVLSFVSLSLWLVLTPKVFQLCTNQLVVWFCAGPCKWLSAYQSS
jgi:hypothetical protein